ncbi:MAG TPA: hypothetical protein VNV39_17985 [Stellaceae bacterium]|nr:hypothetical protein [Stellaceae bacterium]
MVKRVGQNVGGIKAQRRFFGDDYWQSLSLAVGLIPANPAFATASVVLAGIVLGQLFFLLATHQ